MFHILMYILYSMHSYFVGTTDSVCDTAEFCEF